MLPFPASTDAQNESPRPPPSLPLSTPLTCQFLSCLPLADVVINLFLSVSMADQWAVLGAGADTAALDRDGATKQEFSAPSPTLASSRHVRSSVHSALKLFMKSPRMLLQLRKYP